MFVLQFLHNMVRNSSILVYAAHVLQSTRSKVQKRRTPTLYQYRSSLLAPQVRLELTTLRLTAECSAIELLRIIFSIHLFSYVWEREKLSFLPLLLDPGNFLLSQAVPSSVPSAFGGLTSVFGMGTGGSLQLSSPETFSLPFALRSFALASPLLPLTRSLRPSGFAPLPHASRASASLPPHLQNRTGSRVDQQFKHSLILSLSQIKPSTD